MRTKVTATVIHVAVVRFKRSCIIERTPQCWGHQFLMQTICPKWFLRQSRDRELVTEGCEQGWLGVFFFFNNMYGRDCLHTGPPRKGTYDVTHWSFTGGSFALGAIVGYCSTHSSPRSFISGICTQWQCLWAVLVTLLQPRGLRLEQLQGCGWGAQGKTQNTEVMVVESELFFFFQGSNTVLKACENLCASEWGRERVWLGHLVSGTSKWKTFHFHWGH